MARRQRIYFGYHFVVLVLIGGALVYVAVSNLSRGHDVGLWVAVLVAVPIVLVLVGWLLRWIIKREG